MRLMMWDRPDLRDGVELVVSELVSNAVKATEGHRANLRTRAAGASDEVVGLSVYPMGGRMVVEVWDCSLAPPRLMEAGEDSENGRGLFLVDSLSGGIWGHRRPRTGGKVVYASIGKAL